MKSQIKLMITIELLLLALATNILDTPADTGKTPNNSYVSVQSVHTAE